MPRVIAGRWKGRRLETLPGVHVRPTADRVREAWMSIVHTSLPGARVLDLFAGSGALGIEALSRGAEECDFVDIRAESLRVIQSNLDTVDAGESARVHRADALTFVGRLAAGAYDVAFADPPYTGDFALRLAECWLNCSFAHILGIEHAESVVLPGGAERRRYGSTAITIFR